MGESFRSLTDADADTEIDPSAQDAWIGRVVDKRYRIESRIGEGGMGAVYIAEHLTLKKHVAFKTIHPQFAGDGEIEARFAREASVSARLEHPNIANAMDYGTLAEGGAYLVMQLVRGPSLLRVLEKEGSLGWPRACVIGAQVADALAASHAAGVVHRDLKPENVLLERRDDESELAKVLDFGIARFPEEGNESTPRKNLTRRGTVMGTPGYMSPEQALGEDVVYSADIYALGVLVWEMVSGRPLFPSENLTEIVTQQLGDEPVPPMAQESGDPSVPAELQELVEQMLGRQPSQRPDASTARDLLRQLALKATVEGDPRASAPLPRLTPVTGRNPVFRAPSTTGSTGRRTGTTMRDLLIESAERTNPKALVGFGAAIAVSLLLGLVIAFAGDDDQQQGQASPEMMEELLRQAQQASASESLARDTQLLLEASSRDVRRQAALHVLDYEPADEVPDYVRVVAELEAARGCDSIDAALERIRSLGDPRARWNVEQLSRRPRRGCGRNRRHDCYRCVRRDIRETLESLPVPEGD